MSAGFPRELACGFGPRDAATRRKVFDWVLENVGGQSFRDWTPFEHPQLGPVEVGGMVYIRSYRTHPATC